MHLLCPIPRLPQLQHQLTIPLPNRLCCRAQALLFPQLVDTTAIRRPLLRINSYSKWRLRMRRDTRSHGQHNRSLYLDKAHILELAVPTPLVHSRTPWILRATFTASEFHMLPRLR